MISELPSPRRRARRGGPALAAVTVQIEVVTPILGGASQTRSIDEIEVIRAATVRGHLRFWWRALHAHRFQSPAKLHAEESELWGRAATKGGGGRSQVDIRIDVDLAHCGQPDPSNIQLRSPGAYALWPARGEEDKAPVPRRSPGTRFQLTFIAPLAREVEIRDVVRAWILFGGYGSRTRRGVGSLTVVNDRELWLPIEATRKAITALFGYDVLESPGRPPIDMPRLGGAALQVAHVERDPMKAWLTALDWLREFRQGTSGQPGHRAREPEPSGQQPARPSISNWPEADKIRHLEGRTSGHRPHHSATPAWPRAGFGLPINGRFQTKSRSGALIQEPEAFELRWRLGAQEHDRLASPLIVKALPLADEMYVPCAVWLDRANPKGGEVVLTRVKGKRTHPRSAASFDRLLASDDTARFSALAGKRSLREAFLDWLRATRHTKVVAP